MTTAINVSDLSFGYGGRPVIKIERCTLTRGQSLAVIGPSGCGKTTFLHLLAGLLSPDAGRVQLMGQDLSELTGSALDRFRGRHIGLVFQQFHLIRALSVHANLELAAKLARCTLDHERFAELYRMLGLDGLQQHKPAMLSQGQAQRVAIARALVHRPPIIMADEPTSALDDSNAERVMHLLKDTAAAADAALLIVTHDQRVRGALDAELELEVLA
ncbi:MAG: ATP-binding cassette domain-containing protein [Pseudomonadota bacterium]